MSEKAAFPMLVLFGIVTVMLVRSRDIKKWEAACVGLFGFYLGQTAAVYMIDEFVKWVFARFTT